MSFIVLDGVDGCGKTTQAALLVERLRGAGRVVQHLREPGSTPVGEALRDLLLDTQVELGAEVEVLLFAASRRQLLDTVVGPALARGEVVVCERHNSSTYAYQAVAGELQPDVVLGLLRTWASSIEPARVVILDVDPVRARDRRAGEVEDRIEAKGLAYQGRVAEGYRQFARAHDNAVLLDGSGAPEVVADRVWMEVQGGL